MSLPLFVIRDMATLIRKSLGGQATEKSTFFKELTPRSLTYELLGQEKNLSKIKANKHITLPYKNYLQNRLLPPYIRH